MKRIHSDSSPVNYSSQQELDDLIDHHIAQEVLDDATIQSTCDEACTKTYLDQRIEELNTWYKSFPYTKYLQFIYDYILKYTRCMQDRNEKRRSELVLHYQTEITDAYKYGINATEKLQNYCSECMFTYNDDSYEYYFGFYKLFLQSYLPMQNVDIGQFQKLPLISQFLLVHLCSEEFIDACMQDLLHSYESGNSAYERDEAL
jgi:hypothetical protein